jgi:hypothetical protein
MKTPIPSQAEYEQHEAKELADSIRSNELAPLRYRLQARNDWRGDLIREPYTIAERVEWILSGHYGFGAQQRAKRILLSRGNHVAQLAQLVANMEWHCPANFAQGAFLSLSKEQQNTVNCAIQGVIAKWKAEQTETSAV